MTGRTKFRAVIATFAAFILWGIAGSVWAAHVQSACRAAGFPQEDVTWDFTAYCVRRVNQTDSVVALSKLR